MPCWQCTKVMKSAKIVWEEFRAGSTEIYNAGLREPFIKGLGEERGEDHTKAYLRQKPQRHEQLLWSQTRRGLTYVLKDAGDLGKHNPQRDRMKWDSILDNPDWWRHLFPRWQQFFPKRQPCRTTKRTITVRLTKTKDLNPERILVLFLFVMLLKFLNYWIFGEFGSQLKNVWQLKICSSWRIYTVETVQHT